MRRRMRNLERQAERVREELQQEVERVRRSVKRELVLYEPPERALAPSEAGVRVRSGAARIGPVRGEATEPATTENAARLARQLAEVAPRSLRALARGLGRALRRLVHHGPVPRDRRLLLLGQLLPQAALPAGRQPLRRAHHPSTRGTTTSSGGACSSAGSRSSTCRAPARSTLTSFTRERREMSRKAGAAAAAFDEIYPPPHPWTTGTEPGRSTLAWRSARPRRARGTSWAVTCGGARPTGARRSSASSCAAIARSPGRRTAPRGRGGRLRMSPIGGILAPRATNEPAAPEEGLVQEGRRPVWLIAAGVALLAAGLAVAVVLLVSGGDEAKAQTHFQKATDRGPDPFTPPADVRACARGRRRARPGGTGSDLVCNRELLIRPPGAARAAERVGARGGVEPTAKAVARFIRRLARSR